MRRECVQLALAAAAASSGLGVDLGGTAETFQQLLPRTFFLFPFSQEAATAAGGTGGEEEKEASPV